MNTSLTPALSIAHGLPLEAEPGLGALTIGGYLREVTRRHTGREALVIDLPSGERVSWSYDKLWERSLEVAKALIAAGVGKGTRVGILMSNRPEYLSSLFGIALAGGIAVSLSTFSTPSELEHLLQASAVSIVLYDRQVLKTDFGAMLTELEPAIQTSNALTSSKFPFLQRLIVLEPAAALGHAREDGRSVERWSDFLAQGRGLSDSLVEARAHTVKPHDAGGLFFSSGTTSVPKGILHAHRAFAIQWWRWPRVLRVNEPVRSWTGNGFFWSANITMVVGTAFSTGGAVILQPTFEAEAALTLIERERVSLMNGRPHQWVRLQSAPNWSRSDLSSVRYVPRGELIREHPSVQSQWERPNSFGTTETMTILSAYTSERPVERKPGAFGTPLPGNTLKVVHPHGGQTLPLGERGELCIKGPTLMLGYAGKSPEDTFDDEGYFHTGDGGFVDEEGRLFWEGRLTHLIKTGGANVSPEEVDAVIASFPGVRRTQTVGVPHETLSEMVVACVVKLEGASLTEDALIAHLKTRLASFKVPRRVLFVEEAEFALTGNEKTKVDEIRKLASQRLGVAPASDPAARE
ncbi:MAG: class I adenylate-forming enzyme family protein [Polyangiales bacterium]